MIVVVTGAREWRDEGVIRERLARLPSDTLVIHGDQGNEARTVGADRIADRVAEDLGLVRAPYPADWEYWEAKGNRRAAGPIRNRAMLDACPDLVIAFHDAIDFSKGTKDCVREARRRGIAVEIISRPPRPPRVPGQKITRSRANHSV